MKLLAFLVIIQGSIYWGKPPSKCLSFPLKVFPKKIKSYLKCWSYLTTILRNQLRLLMSRNAISANAEHYFFKIFRGSMSRTHLEGLNFLSPPCGSKYFLGLTPPRNKKSKIEPWVWLVINRRKTSLPLFNFEDTQSHIFQLTSHLLHGDKLL